MDLGLKEKVALVTGSYRGTGQAIASALAAEGARVIIHGFTPEQAQQAADDIDGAVPLSADIETGQGARDLGEAMSALDLSPDILINNYGKATPGSWFESDMEAWIDGYRKNALSAAAMVQVCVPAMKARGWGRVIQLGTIGSTRPNAAMPHYYAAKGAMATMTASLAKELAGTGITVNTVSPGLIRTAEVEAQYRRIASRRGWGDDWAEIEKRASAELFSNPSGRMARREEVADLVCFLTSERAAYINGQNVRIDGGAVDIV